VSIYITIVFFALCIGYFMGRHVGWQEGMEEARLYAPLELRVRALNEGICPLCQTTFATDANCEETDT
jgi:hypothetical protein